MNGFLKIKEFYVNRYKCKEALSMDKHEDPDNSKGTLTESEILEKMQKSWNETMGRLPNCCFTEEDRRYTLKHDSDGYSLIFSSTKFLGFIHEVLREKHLRMDGSDSKYDDKHDYRIDFIIAEDCLTIATNNYHGLTIIHPLLILAWFKAQERVIADINSTKTWLKNLLNQKIKEWGLQTKVRASSAFLEKKDKRYYARLKLKGYSNIWLETGGFEGREHEEKFLLDLKRVVKEFGLTINLD